MSPWRWLALVGVPWGFEDYLEALVQVGGVLEMAGEVVEVVLDGVEYVGVGQKGDGCAALGGLVALAEVAGGDAALVFLVSPLGRWWTNRICRWWRPVRSGGGRRRDAVEDRVGLGDAGERGHLRAKWV